MRLFKNYDSADEALKEFGQEIVGRDGLQSLLDNETYQIFVYARKTQDGWTSLESKYIELFPVFLRINGRMQDWPAVHYQWRRFVLIEPGVNKEILAENVMRALRELSE